MPLVQWIMQNLEVRVFASSVLNSVSSIFATGQIIVASANLKCESKIFATGQTISTSASVNLKCESKIYATAIVLAGPISGTKTWENQWNLTGVYAILPNNYKKHKFIEINFKFEEDTYSESRYTENEATIYIRDVLFEEGKEEIRPTMKIEGISLQTINMTNLSIQFESIERYNGYVKPYKKRKKIIRKPLTVVLQGINYE